MPSIDVSLILTLHREGRYVRRSLASLAEAATYARAIGITTELVAVFDCADEATQSAFKSFDLSAFATVNVLRVSNGSLGPSRNDGCAAASGTYLATADADDLVSFNYIERMFFHAERAGHKTILVPQFLLAFGTTYHIAEYSDLADISPLSLIKDHPYLSRVFFHRSLFDELKYQDARLTKGYAYEDWHFNCSAIALGYTFNAAQEVVLFYRQRKGGLLNQANSISTRQIAPSILFQAEYYLPQCAPHAERFRREGDWRTDIKPLGKAILDNPVFQELMLAANAIDPAIEIECFRDAVYFNYLSSDIGVGTAYAQLCQLVGDRKFDEVFLLPFLTVGGADRYILNVMHELVALRPDASILVLFGEPFERYGWLDELPKGTLHINLPALFPNLGDEDRELICFKLLQASAPNARIHVKSSSFGQKFFARFAPVLKQNDPVYYRFSDGRNFYDAFSFVEPSAFHFVSEHIEFLDKIVCDNAGISVSDQNRIRIAPEKWQLMYAKLDIKKELNVAQLEASNASLSLLWLSRLDREKRPSLLLKIAKLLAKRLPDVRIDLFGSATLDDLDATSLFDQPNVHYHGKFESFEDVQAGNYFCFLYTSLFDGMPTVLLEMAEAGCPIIAPSVGGVPELIHDRETGVLITCAGNDDVDAELYVAAVETLYAEPHLRKKCAVQAFALVEERHSAKNYSSAAAMIFGSKTGS
ncbi:glycosyltransferase [Microvirga sp. 2MCAF38]|uniref:glycosyltransferase n=1 Tax=Microvirga sp. 2MCAF38 TaxID=3232989 RepID=UPI003F950C99